MYVFHFWPKNLAFVRKIMALPESGGLQPPVPLARTPMIAIGGEVWGVNCAPLLEKCFEL